MAEKEACVENGQQFMRTDNIIKKPFKLLICDLLHLPHFYHGRYKLYGIQISVAEVMGYVVSKDLRQKNVVYIVDDGTGTISCCKWINNETEKSFFGDFQLGDLITVTGKVSHFREERQIKVETMRKEDDLNSEILHWLDAIKLNKDLEKAFMDALG